MNLNQTRTDIVPVATDEVPSAPWFGRTLLVD